jgi:hypothetical protein
LKRLVKRYNALWLACLTALLFMPSLPLLCKHRFLTLAAVLLLLLSWSLYLFLHDAHLGRLRPLPAPLPKPFSDHLTLLLYKHLSWRGVCSSDVSCAELAVVDVYRRDEHLLRYFNLINQIVTLLILYLLIFKKNS